MNGKNLPKYFEYNKVKIPSIGLGTAYMSNVSEVVFSSIKDGVRLIDTASSIWDRKRCWKRHKKSNRSRYSKKRRFIHSDKIIKI